MTLWICLAHVCDEIRIWPFPQERPQLKACSWVPPWPLHQRPSDQAAIADSLRAWPEDAGLDEGSHSGDWMREESLCAGINVTAEGSGSENPLPKLPTGLRSSLRQNLSHRRKALTTPQPARERP